MGLVPPARVIIFRQRHDIEFNLQYSMKADCLQFVIFLPDKTYHTTGVAKNVRDETNIFTPNTFVIFSNG